MTTKAFLTLTAVMLFIHSNASAEPVTKQFLRFIYGANDPNISQICHPSEDLWMLPGAKNPDALAEINSATIENKRDGIVSGTLGQDVYFIEVRDGKIDPAFNLDGVYLTHRRLILSFLYACLLQDKNDLKRLVTDLDKLKVIGPKAAPGDMDVYADVLALIPVVRSSKASDDSKSKTVTYRLPLGEKGLPLILSKEGSSWKINTSKPLQVPMEFFFR